MKNICFIVKQYPHLKYFIPLAIEASKRGISSILYVQKVRSRIYNCPVRNMDKILPICTKYKIKIKDIAEVNKSNDPVFTVEGVGVDDITNKKRLYVITSMTDFRARYKSYFKKVEGVFLPSEKLAKHFNTISDKNIYLGSPKYDIELSKNEILKKYNLSNNKKVLLIPPNNDDYNLVNIKKICDILRNQGYEIIVKNRPKEPYIGNEKFDYSIGDKSFFPSTTMELLKVCDFLVSCGSTTTKEATLMNKPTLLFDIKPIKHMKILYNYDFIYLINKNCDKVDKYINEIKTKSFEEEFTKCRKECFFEHGSSKRILDYIVSKQG